MPDKDKPSKYPGYVAKSRLVDFVFPERWSIDTSPYPESKKYAQKILAHAPKRISISVQYKSGFLRKFGRAVKRVGGEYSRAGGGYNEYRTVRIPWTPEGTALANGIMGSTWAQQDRGTGYESNITDVQFPTSAVQEGKTVPLSTWYRSYWKSGDTVESILQRVMDRYPDYPTKEDAEAEIAREASVQEEKKRKYKERQLREKENHEAVNALADTLRDLGYEVECYSNSRAIKFDTETAKRLNTALVSIRDAMALASTDENAA